MKTLFLLSALALSSAAFATEPAHPASPHGGMMMPGMGAPAPSMQQARVVSIINVPDYTYIEAAQGKKTVWMAAPTVAVKKGDNIRYDEGMLMSNFYSKTLKRTFPSIYFVSRVVVVADKKK